MSFIFSGGEFVDRTDPGSLKIDQVVGRSVKLHTGSRFLPEKGVECPGLKPHAPAQLFFDPRRLKVEVGPAGFNIDTVTGIGATLTFAAALSSPPDAADLNGLDSFDSPVII